MHNLKISDRLLYYDPRVFFKKIFLALNAAYFVVVREEGMGWGGKTLMEEYVTDDQRFLSHACLESKVERDQDGLHLIIPYRNKTSLGLVFSPTASRLDSQ